MAQARYRVELTRRVAKALGKLDREVARRIVEASERLAVDPRPGGHQKLSGVESLYRIRVGSFRIVYSIEEERLVVLLILIGHRREVYEALRRLR